VTRLPILKSPEELLATALEQAFFLREALEHLRAKVTAATETISTMANRLQATESAWLEEASAREAAEQLVQAVQVSVPKPPNESLSIPASTRRTIADLSSYLEMLLPKLSFTRGSAEFLVLSVTNREPILRILRSLQDSPGDLRHWKTIRGVAGRQERHFSNGQDNTGRIYARRLRDGLIDVLLSMKGTQDRDIAWLQSQSLTSQLVLWARLRNLALLPPRRFDPDRMALPRAEAKTELFCRVLGCSGIVEGPSGFDDTSRIRGEGD